MIPQKNVMMYQFLKLSSEIQMIIVCHHLITITASLFIIQIFVIQSSVRHSTAGPVDPRFDYLTAREHCVIRLTVMLGPKGLFSRFIEAHWLVMCVLSPLQRYSFLYPVKPSGQLKLTLTGLAII